MKLTLSLPSLRLDGGLLGRAVWKLERAMEEAKDQTGIGSRQRIMLVLAVFCLVYGVLAAGAIKAAVFNPEARADAFAPLPAGTRADLVDRNGQLLAVNLLHYGLFIDPREIWDVGETEAGLARLLPGAGDRIDKALHGSRRTRVMGDLTPALRDQIRALGLPGVSFEDEQARIYPLGSTAAQLIGFTDTGGKGLGGAERAFDDQLAGSDAPIALSIDLRVQAALDEEVGKTFAQFKPLGAVGIVVDTQTGEILGMSSYPNYDPNRSATPDQQQNRAANALYEMGSTFKAFTIAAGLDSGAVTTASRFDATKPINIGISDTVNGVSRIIRYRTVHDMRGEQGGIMSVVDIFTNSSNVGTAQIGERIGRDRLKTYFDKLGLTSRNGVELPESAWPLLPKVWDDDAMISASFGHGLKVTPVALAQAYSGIINGGMEIPLTIRKRPGPPPVGTRVVSPQTSETMLQIMRANVVRGTGKNASVPGIAVGGKTGTGEKVINGKYDNYKEVSSFAAAFPVNGGAGTKRYFVLVLVDEPNAPVRTGAIVAAPAVGKVIDRIAPFLGVPRQDLTGERIIASDGTGNLDNEDGGGGAVSARLSALLARPMTDDPLIAGVTADSRKVAKGFLFAALPGSKSDGATFAQAAVRSGAVVVLAGEPIDDLAAPVVIVHDVRRAYALAAGAFWKEQPATCVAVTGTNGKTSVAGFCRQIFAQLGHKSASVGTLGCVVSAAGEADQHLTPPGLTTPDSGDLAALLARLAGMGVTHLALEASSHGIVQRRLDGVRLKAAGFTNLTQDHLDYHHTLEAYQAAKLRLFQDLLAPGATAVLNADSAAYGAFAAAAVTHGQGVLSVGAAGQGIGLTKRTPHPWGQILDLLVDGEAHQVALKLVGQFQAENALVAAGLCVAAGEAPQAALEAMAHLTGAPGRLQAAGSRNGAQAYIDYAHTPDGLETVLKALRPHASGRLILVFGAGGDRDAGKRPMMGRAAANFADIAIVTDDNPRSEIPAAIRAAIMAAAPRAREIPDRGEAIRTAVSLLQPGDILVVAGKGHEQGQIVGAEIRPFDDLAVTHEALNG